MGDGKIPLKKNSQVMNENKELPAEGDHSHRHPRGESVEIPEHGKRLAAEVGAGPRAKQELGDCVFLVS